MSDRLNELYLMEQKAQKMEMINEEVALKIYLDIFEQFTPKISRTYESTIRLLEKRHRYDEALNIAEKAIEGIKKDEVSGIITKFETSRDRLIERKKACSGGDCSETKKKYVFKKQHLIGVLILLAFIAFLFYYTAPERELDVNLEGLGPPASENSPFTPKNEPTEDTKRFPVTETMIAVASDYIGKYIDVVDSDTIPQGATLGIAIIVKPGTSEDRAKEIAKHYLTSLAGAAAAEYSDLAAPTADSLGELYDYYELIVVVGTSTAPEDAIARGTKVKRAAQIYWRRN